MRLLIACDKYKGSLTAPQVAETLQQALRHGLPDDTDYDLCPIADGGEGTTEAMVLSLRGEWRSVGTLDAQGRPRRASYGWLTTESGPEAVLEMSAASGLALVSDLPLVPEIASTYGTGLLMRDAVEQGAKRILMGIGGSATNDGGLGLAAALGYRFWDAQGQELVPQLASLDRLERVEAPSSGSLPPILVACDVDNPLLGPRGATAVYGPQKGVRDVGWFESRLERLVEVVQRDLGQSCQDVPGAGAAGGLGWGLMVFAGAKLTPGFDLVADHLGLEARVAAADLVITGEGRLDAQTLCGKGPMGIAQMARRLGKPVAAFAGSIDDSPALREAFDLAVAVKPPEMPLEEAMARSQELLTQAVDRELEAIRRLLGLAR